jgi:hypothetical protein
MTNTIVNTTVICSVYSQDPHKLALLRGHMENLDKQNIPIDRIYVFEQGDRPPEWLSGTHVSVSRSTTIYEAWNLAILLSQSHFIMNLNLDDRLNSDAISLMQAMMNLDAVKIVGGEWEIKFSQAECDQTSVCGNPSGLKVRDTWPPKNCGERLLLGSGLSRPGTLGPATLWRREVHHHIGAYCYEDRIGGRERVACDLWFWRALQRAYGPGSIARLPFIIGNYHSHPQFQAEFRTGIVSDNVELVREHQL